MRLTLIIAIAAILAPAALSARTVAPSSAIETVSDVSAAKKSKAKVKRRAVKPREEYLKAAPSAEPKRPTPQY